MNILHFSLSHCPVYSFKAETTPNRELTSFLILRDWLICFIYIIFYPRWCPKFSMRPNLNLKCGNFLLHQIDWSSQLLYCQYPCILQKGAEVFVVCPWYILWYYYTFWELKAQCGLVLSGFNSGVCRQGRRRSHTDTDRHRCTRREKDRERN